MGGAHPAPWERVLVGGIKIVGGGTTNKNIRGVLLIKTVGGVLIIKIVGGVIIQITTKGIHPGLR